jgi:prepilin signal peptidase PulO-like enzyme (type II secretory pathway)
MSRIPVMFRAAGDGPVVPRPRVRFTLPSRRRLAGGAAALTAGWFVLLSHQGWHAALFAFVAGVAVASAAVDLKRRLIPNRLVLPAIGIVLASRLAVEPGRSYEFAIAAAAAGLFFLAPNLINRSLVGMGDVKLAVLLGLALGWNVFGALLVASLSFLPVALVMLIRRGPRARRATLPFGPFLATGALVVLLLPHLVRS